MKHPPTFYITEHGAKEKLFEATLKKRGWKKVGIWNRPKVCIFDSDGPPQRNALISHQKRAGSKTVLYPHAAVPPYWYDCGMTWCDDVDLRFVSAPTHKWLLSFYGCRHETRVVGWPFGDVLPPRTSPEIKSIVFAPKHHNGNGFLSDIDKDTNLSALMLLLDLQSRHGFHLIVRHIGSPEMSGLPRNINSLSKSISLVYGKPDLTYSEIDHTDIVVSTHTYAYLAISRGCPTVMYGEEIPPHTGNSEDTVSFCKRWDEYKGRVKYPIDLLCGDPWTGILRAARSNDQDVWKWKNEMFGGPFVENAFINAMNELIEC